MARGRGRLLLVASDGTAWSIPERGVEVGGERRLLPVRERFDDVRALAERTHDALSACVLSASVGRRRMRLL